jgi:Fic family protein
VRETGDWEGWLRFFLEGIVETAGQAVGAARKSLDLFERDQARIRSLGRPAGSALRVHRYLQRHPIASIPKAAESLNLSQPTVTASLAHLERLGLVREITGKKTWRLFAYSEYMELLSEGTEPLR